MTTSYTLRHVAEIQKRAFDDMQTALNMSDYTLAAECAAVVTACATLRLAGAPARATDRSADDWQWMVDAIQREGLTPAPARATDRATYYEDTADIGTVNDVGAYQSEAEYMRDEIETDWRGRRHDRD